MLRFTREFHAALVREGQVGPVPGAALPLTVATLAVALDQRFASDFIADRAAGASAGISLAHVFSPTIKGGAQRKLQTAIFSIASVLLFAGDGADALDNLLPSSTHALESRIVLRRDETGMDKAKARSVSDPGKDPRDDGIQP